MKRQLGLSVCGAKDITPAGLLEMRQAGIDTLEYSYYEYDGFDFKARKKEAEDAGISVWSVHLPFIPFATNNIASLDRRVCEDTVRLQSELIRKVGDAGIKTVVIHPSGEPNEPETRKERMKNAKECLSRLAAVAAEAGTVIAVEDLPRSCLGCNSAEILELISVDPRLTVCFDTNHLLGEKIADFVTACGKYFRTIHVSDYDLVDERHWLPGEGVIDWRALMADLDRVGYQGPFLYEIDYKTPRTITRPRDLTAADFARNKKELEEGLPLTVFGKPTGLSNW